MGTGQMSPALVAAGRAVAAREARKVGEDHSSPVVMKLAFDAYNKRFAPNRTAFDWLSVDQGNVDRYLKDPLCGENPTVGLFREMLSGITLNSRQANLKKMNLNTPVLFISGQQDPVGDCGKGVERAAASFRRAGYSLPIIPPPRIFLSRATVLLSGLRIPGRTAILYMVVNRK